MLTNGFLVLFFEFKDIKSIQSYQNIKDKPELFFSPDVLAMQNQDGSETLLQANSALTCNTQALGRLISTLSSITK